MPEVAQHREVEILQHQAPGGVSIETLGLLETHPTFTSSTSTSFQGTMHRR